MSSSTFITVRRIISLSLLRPVLTTTIPTLIDLINDPAYLISLNGSLTDAFSDLSI